MKIKYKLYIVFVSLCLFTVSIISAFSYRYISGDATENINIYLDTTLNDSLQYVESWISINTNAVLDTKDFLERKSSISDADAADLELQRKYPDISDMYIGFEDKRFVSAIGWIPSEGYDPTVRPWYVQAKAADHINYSDPYLDMTTGKYAISVGVPIHKNDGSFAGILAADLLMDTLVNKVGSLDLNGLGYGILLDRDGVALSHPDQSYLNTNLLENPETGQIIKSMLNQKSGRIEYTLKNEKKIALFRQIPSTGWTLGIILKEDLAYKSIDVLRVKLILFGIATFLVSIICVWFFSESFTKRIYKLTEESGNITNGQLDSRIEIKGRDEISELASSFNYMAGSLSETIRNLKESREKYKELVDNSPDYIYSLDMNGCFSAVNSRLVDTLKLSSSDFMGKTVEELELKDETEKDFWSALHKKALDGKRVISEQYEDIMFWGEQRSIDVVFYPYYTDASKEKMIGVTATIRDISEIKRYERNVHRLAYYDQLTDLPNRILLIETLNQLGLVCDSCGTKFAVILMNINDMKRINDSMGHVVGDELLRQFANMLKLHMKPNSIIARVDGGEFIMILPHISSETELENEISNIFKLIQEPIMANGMEIYMGLNMGVTIYPDYSNHISEIIEDADAAMYYAKKKGKNHFQYYDEEMKNFMKERVQLEQELRHALTNNEFCLYYQPIFNIGTGKVRGFEALIRWYKPDGSIVPPNDFIPLAEESGLINNIGNWVLREASGKASLWQKKFSSNLLMSINISPIQMKAINFADGVREIIEQIGLKNGTIEIEVTEGVFIDSFEAAHDILEKLKGAGMSLSMDDFGTGYSSLSYLQNLSFDVLKIDKSFIADIKNKYEENKFAGTIIALAHQLNISTVAEGVEDIEQLEYLKRHNCDFIQGYLLAKPMSADEIERKLESGELKME